MAEAISHACSYCGLPAFPSGGSIDSAEPVYCCYGCRLAEQIQGSAEEAPDPFLLARLGIAVFFAMNVMAFTMALWTHDVYGPESAHAIETPLLSLFRWITLMFSIPVYYLLGVPLADNCWRQIRAGGGATDLLLLVGVVAAYVASIPAVIADSGHVYFEVGVLVLVFVTLGRWLEARCKQNATRVLDELDRLLPDEVTRERDGIRAAIPLLEVVPGDVLVVRAGERIPCDGIVLRHPAIIDEQFWTGESRPRARTPGDTALAGSLNLAGDLVLRTVARPQDGAIARLGQMIRLARTTRGSYELLAERLSRVFLPLVIVIAVGAALVHGWRSGFDAGLFAGLAVVLIACPCALGIATPMAVWAGLGLAARRGIVFQSGDILERLAGVRAVFFDKTGTLTTGVAQVLEVAREESDVTVSALPVAAELARASHHPLSRAIVDHAKRNSGVAPTIPCGPVTTVAGRGLEATLDMNGRAVPARLGSPRFLREFGAVMSPALERFVRQEEANGRAVVGIAWDGRVRSWFAISESPRPEAKTAIEDLQSRGIEVRILTGDHRVRAERIASRLGVQVEADLMPEDKWRILRETRSKVGPVAMVGDGINDSPALAGADVGIALGCGADVARAAAGICLVSNDLSRISVAIDLSRLTIRTIRVNLFWAIAYNVVGIGLAAVGWLNPVIAAIVMVGSSLFVVGNSARLARTSDPATDSRALAPRSSPEAA